MTIYYRGLLSIVLLISAINVYAYMPVRTPTISSTAAPSSLPWLTWQTVGTSKLKWGVWDIYIAELKTPNGRYSATETQQLALVIRYLRDIEKSALIKATEDQWQHLAIDRQLQHRWLIQLAAIWPNINKGDKLVFVKTAAGGQFYQDNKPLGPLLTADITEAFLAIWLSPKTAYPMLRKRLLDL